MIRSMMYLRPGNLLKDFIVEESKTDVSPTVIDVIVPASRL